MTINKDILLKLESVYFDRYSDCMYEIFLDNIKYELQGRKIVDIDYDEKNKNKPFMVLSDGEHLYFNQCI